MLCVMRTHNQAAEKAKSIQKQPTFRRSNATLKSHHVTIYVATPCWKMLKLKMGHNVTRLPISAMEQLYSDDDCKT